MPCWPGIAPVASEPVFQPQQRLHPLSWLFTLTAYIRQLIVPLAAFLIFGARDNAALWGAIVIVPLFIGALWQQLIYRYGFGPRGLVIQDGLFFRNVRQIEYPRIENIDIERGVLHRLLGVAQVSIATSTGGKAEASIRVLSLSAVQKMRESVFAAARPTQSPAAAETAATPLLRLPAQELIRYGLIDNRGMIVVAAVGGLLYQGGSDELIKRTANAWLESSQFHEFVGLGIAMQVGLAIAGLFGILLSLRLFSVAFALITLFDFTLSRHEQDFRIRHGLLTRVALTLRIRRIQAVHQTESLLHRVFDRVSLRADLAGDSQASQESQQQTQRTRWLAPVCTKQQAQMLIAAALPDIDLTAEPDWQPLAPRARARMFRQTIYFWIVLALLVTSALYLVPGVAVPFSRGWMLLLSLVGLPFAWARSYIYVKHTRWALTPDAVLFQHGWLTRRLVIAPRNRVQSIMLSSSPFDRHYAMAAVSVDTAGASALRDHIRIPMLPREVAEELAAALYRSRI